MRTVLLIVSLVVLIFLVPPSVEAQVHTVTVAVDGLACPFCAYGVEKKLKKVEGVESIEIRMNEGTVTLHAEEGSSINIGRVPQAVLDSGFTPGEMNVVAEGIPEAVDGEIVLRPGGAEPGLLLEGLAVSERYRLLELSRTGSLVTVEGTARQRPDGWSLTPETVRAL